MSVLPLGPETTNDCLARSFFFSDATGKSLQRSTTRSKAWPSGVFHEGSDVQCAIGPLSLVHGVACHTRDTPSLTRGEDGLASRIGEQSTSSWRFPVSSCRAREPSLRSREQAERRPPSLRLSCGFASLGVLELPTRQALLAARWVSALRPKRAMVRDRLMVSSRERHA